METEFKNIVNENNILEGQVAQFTFENNQIINEVNGKEYTADGNVSYVEGYTGKGFQINGGKVTIPLSDIGINTNTQTVSISFWFKWNGTKDFMPIAFYAYDAWVVSKFFGFNTGQGDIYGIDNPYIEGEFVHTVLIFNKGDYKLNSIYINGVKQTLSEKAKEGPLQSRIVFEKELNISGFSVGENYYRYYGDVIDDLKIFNRALTDTEAALLSSLIILDLEAEKSEIYVNENVSVNLVIDNIKGISAEDVIIKYDNTKLKFLGIDEIDGIKLIKSENNDDGLRFILSSQVASNIANAKKVLLKLNFQGIALGDALVDIINGKVSEGITIEEDLSDGQCGETTISIKEYADVNKNGEYTLLDLAIDGRHFGENPKTLPAYNTDQVVNGAIDDEDLLKIGECILLNSNYKFK